ncbi:MAG: RluA family pseudouridine synthase [Akkermansiaceae bacterium]|jgi:23S rRNA pseudouridine1911/1915/1917 synthase|nr:RluA family pseudouridine synthase [Akkermansiaceae bacterium]
MTLKVSDGDGKRLDAFLALALPELSRSRIQSLIKEGHILLNCTQVKARASVSLGDSISIHIPEATPREPQPQNIPLSVLYEDDDLIVVNKATGMVVHPAAGNEDRTLVNALLHHCSGKLAQEGGDNRPGIVHRLDKDTSGCLVAAKTNSALKHLIQQFAERTTTKLYLCVAQSEPKVIHQTVSNNIARHPVHRQRMDVCNPRTGKPAITDLHRLHTAKDGTSLILCALHTGRTHQIRVHNRVLGHPLLGDPIYSKPVRQPFRASRLMLHAWRLGITHPKTGEWIQKEAPIPEEFQPWCDEATEYLERIRLSKNSKEFSALW